MRTLLCDQTITAAAFTTIENQILAENPHAFYRLAVQLGGHCNRMPVAAKQLTGRGARSDSA
jgi:hypothetical protein